MSAEPPETDYRGLASRIDKAGWQQFSFAKREDHSVLTLGASITLDSNDRLLVVTHSCDLIHHTEQERDVELLAIKVGTQPADRELASQSSRLKFVHAYGLGVSEPLVMQAKINRRFSIPRAKLDGLSPDLSITLRNSNDLPGFRGKSERQITEWLAGRYNRGWTPSEFDRRLKNAVGKIQPCLDSLRKLGVEDMFIRVTPSEELPSTDEPYEISLLLLVDPIQSGNLGAIKSQVSRLSSVIQQQNGLIVVASRVELSSECPYSEVRACLKFPEVFRDALAAFQK